MGAELGDPDRVRVVIENIMGTLNRRELENLNAAICSSNHPAPPLFWCRRPAWPCSCTLWCSSTRWEQVDAFASPSSDCALDRSSSAYLLDRRAPCAKLEGTFLGRAGAQRSPCSISQRSPAQTNARPNHFWDRLTMEYGGHDHAKDAFSLLVKAKPPAARKSQTVLRSAIIQMTEARKPERCCESHVRNCGPPFIYRLSTGISSPWFFRRPTFLNAKRIAVRLQRGIAEIRTKHNFRLTNVATLSRPREKLARTRSIVKSLLPPQDEWAAPVLIEKVPAGKVCIGRARFL